MQLNRRTGNKRQHGTQMKSDITLFRDLPIGQVFDWISGTSADSFFARCVKISHRRYRKVGDFDRADQKAIVYSVGSINAKVYHVGAGN